MTHPRSITTNMKFVYADQRQKLRGLLKYFQHRDDKDGRDHIAQLDENGRRVSRWVDQGLGEHHGAILQNTTALATENLKRNVGARTMVVGPETTLMHAIPEARRAAVLHELTGAVMERWFEKMDLPTPEYAYVVHESQPSDARPDGRLKEDAAGLSYWHAHVVMAATVPGLETEREDYKVYERHLALLHEAGREALAPIWTRELGVERYAELQSELDERDRYQRELDEQAAERERIQQQLDLEAVLIGAPAVAMEPPDRDPPDLEMELDLE